MSNLVIVAIPSEDDYVWKISSEKVPHMTLLFLGDNSMTPGISKILEFTEHAASGLRPFWLDVDYRGTLGADEADVVFFDKEGWDIKEITDFRSSLLQNDLIRKLYDSADQFPEWQPHLTLGYPTAPAKEDKRDYPGIHSVRFDKISVWTSDFDGPEYRLKHQPLTIPEVAMSSIDEARVKLGLDALSHHGIKGMKWGVRRKNPGTPKEVVVSVDPSKKKGKIKTQGGQNQPAHKDAIGAAKTAQILKKSGSAALSNQELSDLQTRLNLEQNVSRLTANQASPAKKFVKRLLGQTGQQQAQAVANEVASRQVKKMLVKGAVAAAV